MPATGRQEVPGDSPDGTVLHHGTYYPGDWPAEDWVHVGTRRSALERLAEATPAHYGWPDDSPARLFLVELNPEAAVYPATLTDEDVNALEGPGPEMVHPGFDVFAYVNDCEHSGSVSYLVHRRALRQVIPVAVPASHNR